MNTLKLRNQLIIIFTLVILVFTGILYIGLERYAKDLALSNAADKAELLLAHQRAIRTYTVKNVRPLVNQAQSDTFISESVPAFAAQTVMGHLNDSYPGYDYREAVEDPTNPKDRLEPWERVLLTQYQSGDISGRQTLERSTTKGEFYSIAEPIIISNPACLACHSDPEIAPPLLLSTFPGGGGFNWQLNVPLGIQSVTVPINVATVGADKIRARLILVVGSGLLFTLFALAFIVHFRVSKPIHRLSIAASKLSMGNEITQDDFPDSSAEMTDIKISLKRLLLSFQRRIRMLKDAA